MPQLRVTTTGIAVLAILLVAAALRLIGLDWDSGHHLHPDERFITQVASAIRFPSPDQYFDTSRSPLNPNALPNTSYVYGTWPLFVTRLLADIIGNAARAVGGPGEPGTFLQHLRDIGGYDNVNLLGRALSALSDVFTILLIFLIGRRLYGRSVGLVAAVLATFTVLMIQTAHFFTVEAPLTLFVTVAIYYAIRSSESGSLRDWALFGVATGLAAATKVSALMLGVVAIGAAVVLWYRVSQLGANPDRRRLLASDLVTGLFTMGALAFVVFRFTHPYSFSGPGIFNITLNARYIEVFQGFQRIGVGEGDVPFNQVWAGTTPYLWQLKNMTLWGMGPPLAIAGWVGFFVAAYQLVRNPSRYYIHALGLIWVAANFIYWGPQLTKLMRYQLPFYPQLIIFAALMVVTAWRWAAATLPARQPAVTADDSLEAARPAPNPGVATVLPWAARAVSVLVVGWTVFYGLAFMSIYMHPVSRITASSWIFANIPPGVTIASEHWDDPLPLGAPGQDPNIYHSIGMTLYDEESPQKRTDLLTKLDQADYIALSSNRLYGSIPRNPHRYPLGTRYYQALFDGELGFEQIADFTSRPSLLGVELNDDNSEESFTVYDHPKVTIFKKAPNYSSAHVKEIFDAVPVERALRNLKPINASSNGLLLDAASWAADRAGGTWSSIFARDSLPNSAPLPIWYLTLELLGLIALPLTWLVCRRLSDAGYALSKTIAILAISYIPWLLASAHLLPYTRLSIFLAMALMAAASGYVLVRHRVALTADLSARRTPILATELLFFVVFLGFTALRVANPDLWHSAYGGEKPMDFAYLNAIIKTTWFPAYDPWLAGGYLNYYYYGQLLIASLIKLTGIVPWVAYNLAIPTVAALAATSLASAVYNILISRANAPLHRQLWAFGGGVAAVLMGIVGGNLHAIQQFLTWVTKLDTSSTQSAIPGVMGVTSFLRGLWIAVTSGGHGIPPFIYDFWGPTRVITTDSTTPITEFPYFTFLYGDLHAHMIAMPLGLLAVGLAINLVRQPAWVPSVRGRPGKDVARDVLQALRTPGALTLALAALDIGIVRMANSWDFPTYLGLTGAAVLLAELLRTKLDWKTSIGRAVVLAAVVAVASQVLILPYLRSNELFYSGAQLTPERTHFIQFVIIMGSFMAILITYLGFHLWGLRSRIARGALFGVGAAVSPMASQGFATAEMVAAPRMGVGLTFPSSAERWAGTIAIAGVVVAVLLFIAGSPVVGISLLGLTAIAILALVRSWSPGTAFLLLLTATALAITGGVEVVTLKGDLGRMNTVFKFYLQVWLFFSIAGGAMLALLVRRAVGSPWLRRKRRPLMIGLGIILAIPFIYTAMATPVKLGHRFTFLPPTLDGMTYMSQSKYADEKGDMVLPDDFMAINWMLDTIQGSPVIVEGLAPIYHWRSRVSVYTGLPTVIGWDWHQTQQRGDFSYMVESRVRDTDAFFNTTSPEAARQYLDRYQVEYVYIGGLERAYYPAPGIEKFDAMVGPDFREVYKKGVVTIYQVVR